MGWDRGRFAQVVKCTLSIASQADVLGLVTREKPKDVCFRTTLSKDLLVPLIPTGYRWSAHVHVAAHRVSPKSSFLNAPRGLILFLIDPIMTSNEGRRSCVIKYADFFIRIHTYTHESPCSRNYKEATIECTLCLRIIPYLYDFFSSGKPQQL